MTAAAALAAAAGIAAALTFALAGGAESAAARGYGTLAQVQVKDNAFTPTKVDIRRGERVNWRSFGNGVPGGSTTNAHNVWVTKLPKSLKRKKSKFRLGIPSTELNWTKRFTVAGRYTFICVPHRDTMRMRVVVSK